MVKVLNFARMVSGLEDNFLKALNMVMDKTIKSMQFMKKFGN